MGDKNRLPDVFSREHLKKLFEEIDNPKTAIASFVSFYCGLRINEVCNLRWRDFDFDNMQLKIVDSKNSRRNVTGYGKDRFVPIPKEVVSPVKKWQDIVGGGEWFLPSSRTPNEALKKKTLYESFHHFLKMAGLAIPRYTMTVTKGKSKGQTKTKYCFYFHTLRHTYATYLLSKGVDIMTISNLLGHNQVTTTQIYARVNPVQASKAVQDAFSSPLRDFKPNYQQPKSQDLVTANQIELRRMELEIKNKELELRKLELLKNQEVETPRIIVDEF